MTESWAIAIMTAILGGMSAILAWIAAALWGIHRDLREFVTKEDCSRQMEGHCAEIDNLWAKVRENESKVTALQTIAHIFHNSEKGN